MRAGRIQLLLAIFTSAAVGVVGFLWMNFDSTPLATARRAVEDFRQLTSRTPKADVLLPIVFDRQDHALSCEVADLKMVLAYRGISVSEAQLIADVGMDPTPKTVRNGVTIWGDPQKGFVGNIDGRMLRNGYGVYWEPIAWAASKYRKSDVVQNLTPAELASHIAAGDPVIAWGYLGSGKRYQWQTPEGRVVDAVYSEHPFIVFGFKGTVDAPEGFFLMDPIYGKKYMKTQAFMANWSAFGYSGVIVY